MICSLEPDLGVAGLAPASDTVFRYGVPQRM